MPRNVDSATPHFQHLRLGYDRRFKIFEQIYWMGCNQLILYVLFDTRMISRTRLIQRSCPSRPSKTNPSYFLSKSYWPKIHSLIQEHMYYADTFRASIIQHPFASPAHAGPVLVSVPGPGCCFVPTARLDLIYLAESCLFRGKQDQEQNMCRAAY